jgi:peptidoglycan hydrolase CwlO-like protein
MKKPVTAVLVALFITACVGVSVLTVGGAALLNKNGVSTSNSLTQSSDGAGVSSPQQDSQADQTQSLIAQYQDHEQQYQQREQQLQEQLSQANAQIQQDQQTIEQFQNLLTALQQRGVIRITNDGRVFIN